MLPALLFLLLGPAWAASSPPVEVRLVEVQGVSLSMSGASGTVRVEAVRKVGTPLKVRRIDAALLLNQVELAAVETHLRARLRRDKPVVIDLPVRVDAATAVTAAVGALGRGQMDFRVKGQVGVTTWWFFRREIPVDVSLSP